MKQIIVNVGGLTIEEKQRVNEALAKIKNIMPCPPMFWGFPMDWDSVVIMFVASDDDVKVGFDYCANKTPTHTPQQVLEMAGIATKRKVRKDFDPSKKYRVYVSECTEAEKKEVQQAFFDVGFPWEVNGEIYQHLGAAKYTNATNDGDVTAYCMFGVTTWDCNMTFHEFLDLVYEPEKKGHVHAELMALYAQDAKTHSEPWKLWQVKADDGVWWGCDAHPRWANATEYRRKPKTHIVNGVEVPDLRIEPKNGQGYWYPDASIEVLACGGVHGYEQAVDSHRLANNLCYEPTEDGKQAAILHAKAMLGIA